MLLKKAGLGLADIPTLAKTMEEEVNNGTYDKNPEDDKLFALENHMVRKMKNSCIIILGNATTKLGKKLET